MKKQELANWLCQYRLSKYHQDIEPYRGREEEFHRLFQPYQVIEGEGNCLLNSGIDEIWDFVTGVEPSATDWTASTAYSVGDIVAPTGASPCLYKCTTAGTSGASEPTWDAVEGNTVTDNTVVWTCIGNARFFNNANAKIGVGDSSTAADATQTDLQAATNKTYKGMETGYPTSASQKANFKASFGSSEANYTWNEWVIKSVDADTASNICLNRKVENLGTKTTGTWTLEVSITLS